ncbi:hypothetical protein ACF3NG_03575 [Aerococcaceae bacterium WGS1372]
MLFDVLVVIILAVLVVNQFGLWTKFKNWYNRQVSTQTVISQRNHKVYIFIVLIAVVFALVISFIQSTKEINQTATTLALQQLAFNTEGYSQSALYAQTEVFKNALDFSSLFWLNFFEKTAYFILIPILISIATVFINDEMQKTKSELEENSTPLATEESVEKSESTLVDPVEVDAVEEVTVNDDIDHVEENQKEKTK